MKFSFDIEDIDEIAEEWFRILVANQETNKAIDASDCRYIAELMLWKELERAPFFYIKII